MSDNRNRVVHNQKQTQKRSFFGLAAVAGGVLLLVFSIFSLATSDSFAIPQHAFQAVETAEEREWTPELPVRLMIPAIDVDAKIQYVGIDPGGTGEMEVPSNFTDVGWYEAGVLPGERGSAVMAGHLNGKQVPEAVFYDLHTLEIGDEVIVMSAGRERDIFKVVKVVTYAHTDSAVDVFTSTDGTKRLNLITCSGDWLSDENQYNKRTVVFTELLTDGE